MKTVVFTVGDSYPNLKGSLYWGEAIDVPAEMTGIMLANCADTGPFTGPLALTVVTTTSGTQIDWVFDVQAVDTALVARYKLSLRLTHDPAGVADIETVNPDVAAEVVECG